ncbi:MAG: SPOR domain-containing protein [Nitrospinae bacterium]|nr:SPOR domain-containing protein [Nitrospinota bacterium]
MADEKMDDLEELEKDLLKSAKSSGGGSKKLAIILLIVIIIAGGGYVGIKYLPSLKKPPAEEVAAPPAAPPAAKRAEAPPEEKAVTPAPAPKIKEAPAVPAAPSEKKYTVQIGTYVLKSSLDAASKEVKEKGFTPFEIRGTSNIASYRVEVGEFQNAEEVRNIVKKLIGRDIEVKFKIVSKGIYTLSAGIFYDKNRADEFKDKLIEKGYPAKVSDEKGKKKVYILRLGDFKEYKEAKETRAKLMDKGINCIIVKH